MIWTLYRDVGFCRCVMRPGQFPITAAALSTLEQTQSLPDISSSASEYLVATFLFSESDLMNRTELTTGRADVHGSAGGAQ